MKQSFTAALLAVFAGAVMPTVVSAAEAMASGTFTEEQFERGQVLYERECASCHGANLEGGCSTDSCQRYVQKILLNAGCQCRRTL